MRKNLLPIFICPKCGSSLKLEIFKKIGERINEGKLLCGKCKKNYQIINDIIIFKEKFTSRDRSKKKIQKMKVWCLGHEFKKTYVEYFTKPEFATVQDEWEWMIRESGLRKSKIHLDWCAGTGRFLRNILDLAQGEIIVLEIDYPACIGMKALFKKIKRYSNVTIVCGDARKLPFASGTIGSITSWNGLGEVGMSKAVTESKRVLKKNGVLAVSGLFYDKGSKSLKAALNGKVDFARNGEAVKYFDKVGFRDIGYRVFLKSKCLDRKMSFLPKFGDYYTNYGIKGRK